MAPTPVIGIDLGTSNLCVATFQDGHPIVIPNQLGNETTPAYIAFTENERFIGELAKVQAGWNSCNTVYETKRIVGRRWDSALVQRLIKFWPFEVREDDDDSGAVVIHCKYHGKDIQLSPEDISAMLLRKMKETVESYTNSPCTRATISAPAYFTDSQRQATRDAAHIAGIDQVTLISEPVAAALAYGIQHGKDEPRTGLVYDFGGGYLDVSVVTIQQTKIQVLASAGDADLGGDDFDLELVTYFTDEFRAQNEDVWISAAGLRKLKMACEKAKRILSTNTDAFILMSDKQDSGLGFHGRLTRAQFEVICAHLFRAAMRPVRLALDLAGIDKGRIDDIICIGSNTKIPRIRQQLEEFFGKPIYQGLDPDVAVAMGAATMAAILDGQIQDVEVEDIKPLTIGVGVGGGRVVHVNDRCGLPIEMTRVFTTDVDNQTEIRVDVYEGTKWTTRECHHVGSFVIPGLKPAPLGQIQVPVVFTVDRNGILTVHASDKELPIEKGRLTRGAIEDKASDTLNYAAIEEERRRQLVARFRLEEYLVSAQILLGKAEETGLLSSVDETALSLACIHACKWLHNESHSQEDYEHRLDQLKKEIEPVLATIVGLGK